jgi:hypothetical protein
MFEDGTRERVSVKSVLEEIGISQNKIQEISKIFVDEEQEVRRAYKDRVENFICQLEGSPIFDCLPLGIQNEMCGFATHGFTNPAAFIERSFQKEWNKAAVLLEHKKKGEKFY